MVEHGRGRVQLQYGRRLFSAKATGGKDGDFTLKVCERDLWIDFLMSGVRKSTLSLRSHRFEKKFKCMKIVAV